VISLVLIKNIGNLVSKLNYFQYISHVGEMKNAYYFWSENLKGRDHLEDVGINGMIILYWK
jgi:hypothetical protein